MATRKVDLEKSLAESYADLNARYLELLCLRLKVEQAAVVNGITNKAVSATKKSVRASRPTASFKARRRRSRCLRSSIIAFATMASMVSGHVSHGGSRCMRPIGQTSMPPRG